MLCVSYMFLLAFLVQLIWILRISAEIPEPIMCVDAQIPNRDAEFFLRMVAEPPTLDALRILYVSFKQYKFCVYPQKVQNWSCA